MKKFKTLTVLALALLVLSCGTKQNEMTLNVMSFNIRYDNPRDSLNNWQYRKDFAANLILFHDVDILGTQEVMHNQLEDLKTSMPQYSHIGVGRLDGATQGEYSAILYKTDKFELVKSGTFWLAEDINAVGVKGWDAACERVVTWAVFKDKGSKHEFCVLNTHFDHIGEVARSESAKIVVAKAKELSGGLPVIVTGDFNAEPSSGVIKTICDKTNPDHLLDTRELATLVYGPEGSFHDFGRIDYDDRPLIDYIFVKGQGIKVSRLAVLSEMHNATYMSDHFPVLATIKLGN